MTYPKIRNTSYLTSIGVHGLIVMLFLLFKHTIEITPNDYVEVGFGNPGGSGGGGNGMTQVESVQNEELGTPEVSSSKEVVKEEIKTKDLPKVEPPKALNNENDNIAAKADVEKKDTKTSTGNTGTTQGVKTGTNGAAGIGTNPLGTGIGNGIGRGSGNGNGSGDANGDGYDIFWGGKGNRRIYSYVLPKYPEGVSKEIDVKLKFTILPDGTVGTIFPIMKSDTRLENAAINSLRQWRFEPLPSGQKQMEQTAVIIFPYRLQ
ncbi:MAG: TonB family protein [Ignavibacteriales bacterium]